MYVYIFGLSLIHMHTCIKNDSIVKRGFQSGSWAKLVKKKYTKTPVIFFKKVTIK